MKKLKWSSFAVSLIFLACHVGAEEKVVEEFLGMETELLSELEGPQKFTPRDHHQKSDWNVQEKEVEIDVTPLKGQTYSIIPWETQDPENFLSIDQWMIERSIKDKSPEWKIRLRDIKQVELVGKVLQCKGVCEVYRGTEKARVQHLSRITEGDELKTLKDSVAWVYLMDGTLLRLSSESSVSFQEINWSESSVLHLLRLNEGHLYWHPRSKAEFPQDLSAETDAISLPLLIREANQENFERALFASQKDVSRMGEILKLDDSAMENQIKKVNELRVKNSTLKVPDARLILITPNLTLDSKLSSLDILHLPTAKTFFKRRDLLEGHSTTAILRGYSSTPPMDVTQDSWFEVDPTGRNIAPMSEPSGNLQVTELITKRIKTIELAREIWLERFTIPFIPLLVKDKAAELAVKHGYFLWNEDLEKRSIFLLEYTRRMETSNLRSMENLVKRLAEKGESITRELSDAHYRSALNFYLKGLKNRYTNKKMQVREMNDLQYYVWILRHGKEQP